MDRITGYLQYGWYALGLAFLLVYLYFQPEMTAAIAGFQQASMVIGIIAVIGITILSLRFFKLRTLGWRGWYWLPSLVFTTILVLGLYQTNEQIFHNGRAMGISYFLIFSLILFICLLIYAISAYALGASLKFVLKANLDNSFYLLATGMAVQMFLLTILGSMGIFNFIPILIVLLSPIVFQYKTVFKWLKQAFVRKHTFKSHSWQTYVLFWLINLIISVFWISAIKPFPIGNDGAGLYMTLAHKLADTGSLPLGSYAYGWSVYMASGETLLNATLSNLLSHAPGFLAMFALFNLSRKFISRNNSLLLVLLFSTMPFVTSHFLADEKVDLAVLFFSLVATMMTLDLVSNDNDKRDKRALFITIGLILGTMFSIKYTAIFIIVSFLPVLIYDSNRIKWIGTFTILAAMTFLLAPSELGSLDILYQQRIIVSTIMILIGAAILFWQKAIVDLSRLKNLAAMIFVAGLAFSPWAWKNAGENQSFTLEHILQGQKPTWEILSPEVGYQPLRKNLDPDHSHPVILESSLAFQKDEEQWKVGTSEKRTSYKKNNQRPNWRKHRGMSNSTDLKDKVRAAEVRRFMGFESGLNKFITLPFDLTFSTNILDNRFVDIGFIFLFFLFLILYKEKSIFSKIVVGLSFILSYTLWLRSMDDHLADQVSFFSQTTSSLFAIKHPGILQKMMTVVSDVLIEPLHILNPIIEPFYQLLSRLPDAWSLMISILVGSVIWLILSRNQKPDVARNHLYALIGFQMITFLSFGSGIPWYAMSAFVLSALGIILYLNNEIVSKTQFRIGKIMLITQVVLGIFISLTNPRQNRDGGHLFYSHILNFSTNPGYSQMEVIQDMSPVYHAIIHELNKDTDAKIYSANDYLFYFIKNFDNRVLEDKVLDRYAKLKQRNGNEFDFVDHVAQNGFTYILFQLNTGLVDFTKEGLLKSRCEQFMSDLLKHESTDLIYTDNIIYTNPKNKGEMAYGLDGEVAQRGSIALFKIKASE